jgi:hypothetical protein
VKLILKLDQIVKVKEIVSEGYSYNSGDLASEKVNKALNMGWKLLEIYTTCLDDETCVKQQNVHYVLGLPNTDEIDF